MTTNFPRCGFSHLFDDDDELGIAGEDAVVIADPDFVEWFLHRTPDDDDDRLGRWRRDEDGMWLYEEGTEREFKRDDHDHPDRPLSRSTRVPDPS